MVKRLALILLPLLLLGACSNPTSSGTTTTTSTTSSSLTGYWKSSYGDGFEISGTTYTQYDDATKTVSFAGTIVNSPDLTGTAGGLTLLITNTGTWGKTTGAYYVVRWKSLSSTGVSQSSAYKTGSSSNSGSATQALAESEMTIDNGYFGFFADYAKQ